MAKTVAETHDVPAGSVALEIVEIFKRYKIIYVRVAFDVDS